MGVFYFRAVVDENHHRFDRLGLQPSQDAAGTPQGLVQGFLILASNPKVMIFYLAFVPGFMDLSRVSLSDISLLLILTAIGIASGTWLVAFAASSASQRLNSSGSRDLVNKTAGGTLMGLGVYIGIIKT